MAKTGHHWTEKETEAIAHVKSGLAVIDNVTSYVKSGVGKPSAKERALFAAAIVFAYGVWENYVEQLAIDITKKLSAEIDPENVPEEIRKILDKKTAWELSISPGWRKLWVDHVSEKAVGGEADKFGMNTARDGSVRYLLSLAGVNDPFSGIDKSICPAHLEESRRTVVLALDELVTLRGEIVHTGKVPDSLMKDHVSNWRNYIEQLTVMVDLASRKQCKSLL